MSAQSQQQQSVGSSGSGSGVGSSMNAADEGMPLWKFVEKKENTKGGKGGSWDFVCSFCGVTRSGSYSRVRGHLLHIPRSGILPCVKVTRADRDEIEALEKEYHKNKNDSGPREVPLPSEYERGDGKSKRRAISSPLARAFGIEARVQLEQEIARMFYTGGLPLNLARNPHYVRSYTFAASHNISGFTPPGYNALRTTLLVQERNNVEKQLVPLKATWKQRGVTLVSDGWSDPTRKPLINFMATSGGGPMFLRATNCFGETKDMHFIANLMKEVIEEVGHHNVVQIITNNAAAKRRERLLRDVVGKQSAYLECKWITDVYNDAMQIKNYIMNHNMRLAIFQKFSPLKLLSVADTRFASIIVMLKRLKLIKQGLQSMVISESWSSYREDDVNKANFVKDKILSDDWWDKVTYILDFTRPIYDMIRICDTDKPCLHLVYEMWDSMIEKVKFEIFKKEKRSPMEPSIFYEVVHDILIARWTKNSTPLHCVAHSLNPKYYSHEWLEGDSNRVAPIQDGDISKERLRFFRRYFPNDDDHIQVLGEYADFSMKGGPFFRY